MPDIAADAEAFASRKTELVFTPRNGIINGNQSDDVPL